MRRVWGFDYEGTDRTLDNFVSRLRRKLEIDPDEPQHFLTVRGVAATASWACRSGRHIRLRSIDRAHRSTDLVARSTPLRFRAAMLRRFRSGRSCMPLRVRRDRTVGTARRYGGRERSDSGSEPDAGTPDTGSTIGNERRGDARSRHADDGSQRRGHRHLRPSGRSGQLHDPDLRRARHALHREEARRPRRQPGQRRPFQRQPIEMSSWDRSRRSSRARTVWCRIPASPPRCSRITDVTVRGGIVEHGDRAGSRCPGNNGFLTSARSTSRSSTAPSRRAVASSTSTSTSAAPPASPPPRATDPLIQGALAELGMIYAQANLTLGSIAYQRRRTVASAPSPSRWTEQQVRWKRCSR